VSFILVTIGIIIGSKAMFQSILKPPFINILIIINKNYVFKDNRKETKKKKRRRREEEEYSVGIEVGTEAISLIVLEATFVSLSIVPCEHSSSFSLSKPKFS
jgi:hypothetical protein